MHSGLIETMLNTIKSVGTIATCIAFDVRTSLQVLRYVATVDYQAGCDGEARRLCLRTSKNADSGPFVNNATRKDARGCLVENRLGRLRLATWLHGKLEETQHKYAYASIMIPKLENKRTDSAIEILKVAVRADRI